MKSRAILLGFLATLLLIGTASAAELVLDWPHNEDNGIYCYHCHSPDPQTGKDYWGVDTYAGSDPDFSVANWVCNRCHAPEGIRTIESYVRAAPDRLDGIDLVGPTKQLHSSATTNSQKGFWTTQCIQCHDPHFQTQKDWGTLTGDNLDIYIATGAFEDGGGALASIARGVDPLGGPLGVSTRGILLNTTTDTVDVPVAEWIRKGKTAGFENRDEVGGTRGLILVVNSDDPVNSRTYEIIGVTPVSGDIYTIKVNGQLVAGDVGHNSGFGILYGASIRTNAITAPGVFRDVKYFNPNKVYDTGSVGTYGGPVDLTATETEPVGLCQVCHTATVVFDESTPAEVDSHNDLETDQECTDCHDILTGGEPNVDHSLIIDEGALGCSACHIGYSADPDGGHQTTGCNACHDRPTQPYPDLNPTAFTRVQNAKPLWTDTDGASNNSTEWPLDCVTCHNATYSEDYTNTPTHPDPLIIGPAHDLKVQDTPFCTTACHGAAVPTEAEIVTNIHNDDCALCHESIGPPPLPVVLKAGVIAGSTCTGCHTTYFDGHTHVSVGAVTHDTKTSVTDTALCVTCHAALDPMGVHNNNCWNCHSQTDGARVNGNVNALGYGAAAINVGDASGNYGLGLGQGGQCTDCHSNYFNGHRHHTINNHVVFDGTTGNDQTTALLPCVNCHRDATDNAVSLNDWNGILVEHQTVNSVPVVPGCPTCHSYTNADAQDTPTVAAVNTAITNVAVATINCGDCHTVKTSVDHGGHIGTHFAWGGDCDDCHSATPGAPTEEVVLDIHRDECTLCHFDPDNVETPGDSSDNYNRIVAYDGDATEAVDKSATCLTCHVTVTPPLDKPFIHHENNSIVNTYVPSTSCASANCHNTANGHNADHTAGTAPGMVLNDTIGLPAPNPEVPCNNCHSATSGATADGNNIPLNGTDNKIHDACTTCHEIEAVTNLVKLVATPGPNGYVTAMPLGAGLQEGGTDGGGTCRTCHGAYFEGHTHHNNGLTDGIDPALTNQVEHNIAIDVSYTTPDQECQLCHHDYDDDYASALGLSTWQAIQYEHDRVDTPAGNTTKDGSGACYNCHYSNRGSGMDETRYGVGASVSDVVATPWNEKVSCRDCHYGKLSPKVHGLTYVNHFEINPYAGVEPGVVGTYAPLVDVTGCTLTCHPAGTDISGLPDPITALHGDPTCDVCHTSQPQMLTSPINFDLYRNTGGVDCIDCHQAAHDLNYPSIGLPVFHGTTAGDTATTDRHNRMDDVATPGYSDASAGDGYDCMACHMTTLAMADVLSRHMPGYVDQRDCQVCHMPDNYSTYKSILPAIADTPAQTVIDNGKVGTTNKAGLDQPVACEDCHYDASVYTYKLHGMNDADAAGVHDKIASSNAVPDINCANCHDMTTNLKIIELHTSPKNTINPDRVYSANCLSCHLPAPSTAATVIANGQGAGGSTQNCANCHTGAAVYLMHGLAFGTGVDKAVHDELGKSANDLSGTKTDCDECHSMAASTDRLDLHSVVGCTICHNNGTDFITADTAITNAWNEEVTVTANCEGCHSGTNYTNHSLDEANLALITLHNQLAPEVTATSSCGTVTCHDNNTDTKILAFHGANDCLICHSSSQPAGVQGVITAGVGGSPSLCESCHSSTGGLPDIANDWFLHANYTGGIDHTTAGLVDTPTITSPPTVNCTSASCHGGLDPIDVVPSGVGVHDMAPDSGDTYSCALCHDAAGLLINSAATHGGGAECLTCHGAYFDSHTQRIAGTAGHAGIDSSYYTNLVNEDWTQAGSGCGNCHDDAVPINALWDMTTWNGVLYEHDLVVKDGAGACVICHDYDGTNGMNSNNVVGTDATNAIADVPEDVTCGSCHDAKAQGGPTAGASEDHGGHTDAHFGWDGNCDICHSPSYPAAPTDANDAVVRIVHGDTCGMCHTNPPGTNTADTESTGPAANGVDANAFLANGDAGTWAAVCTTCHNTTTYPSGTVHHDSLEWDTNASCENCHGPAADHHTDLGGGPSVINYNATLDISQETNNDPCHSCHYDKDGTSSANAFNTFEKIRYEHDIHTGGYDSNEAPKDLVGGCVTCHFFPQYLNQTGDAGTPVQTDVDNTVGATTAAATTCVDCHKKKESSAGASSTHGGHSADFPKTGNSAPCVVCHNSTLHGGTGDVVMDIHASCDSCHFPAGEWNAGTNSVSTSIGDSTLAEGDAGIWASECTVCHIGAAAATHHSSAQVVSGNCTFCHVDRRSDGGIDNLAYKKLACMFCHVVSDGATGIKVIKFTLKDPVDGAIGDRSGNTPADVPNHAFPNTPTADTIQNYGACLGCHGQNGVAPRKMLPLHGLPTPTDGDTPADVGILDDATDRINLMGGGGFRVSTVSGDIDLAADVDFGMWGAIDHKDGGKAYRGAYTTGTTSQWNTAYVPIGKGVVNFGWALYSQIKMATEKTSHKSNESSSLLGGAGAPTYFQVPAGVQWGYLENLQHDGNASHFIPHWDADPQTDLGVDNLTERTPWSANWPVSDGSPTTTRTITVDVQSDDLAATLSVIYGGHTVATGPTPLNVTLDFEVLAKSYPALTGSGGFLNGAGATVNDPYSLYHSNGVGVLWVVSDKGGSITLSGGGGAAAYQQ
ncbi:MAG: hypothetical protein ABFS18_12010 [Thermodesulfobacteriota bacterium]